MKGKILFLAAFFILSGMTFVSAEKVVLFAMDDFQVWWLTDIQDTIVNVHANNSIPVTLGVIPSGITEQWGEGERFSNRIKVWDAYPTVEVAQHGFDHNPFLADETYTQQYDQIKQGNNLIKSLGIIPTSFIPPFGSANLDTVNVLLSFGFHTLYNPVEMSPTSDANLSIIQNQLSLCTNGDEGPSCTYKPYSTIKSEIDAKISQYNVALVLYHMQDFNKGTDNAPVFDSKKASQIVNYSKQLKQDGYTLMTVEQYYQFMHQTQPPSVIDNDKDGYNSTVDCNDSNADVWQMLTGYLDNDKDNYGSSVSASVCSGASLPSGYSDVNTDCNDNNSATHPNAADSCDGIDNDCDNSTDEDFLPSASTCGLGICTSTGNIQCSLGKEVNSCVPLLPVKEICNNLLDDDCDGKADAADSDCAAYCGDNTCNANETCLSCSSDCGQCSIKTITLNPNGQGYRKDWTNVGCISSREWQCVDESSINNSDYLRDSGTSRETFTFTDINSPVVQINNVTLFYYSMWDSSKSNSCFGSLIRARNSDYVSGKQMCSSSSWAYLSYSYSKNPTTGLPWTLAEVNALEAGMYSLNPNGGGRVSQVYAVVEYI
jgi:peptidoglycan/xylan/chitin deacetylase (PgdA/CDA1 family)